MLEAGDAASSAEFVDTTGSPSLDDVQRWIGECIVAEGEPVELRRGSIWAGAYLEAVEEMAQGLLEDGTRAVLTAPRPGPQAAP